MTRKQILMSIVTGFAGLLITATATANAAVEGPYIGGALGWGDTHQTDFLKNTNNTSGKDTGLAGRVFAGLQFNQNLAAELGYSKFTNATYKTAGTTTSSSGVVFNTNTNATIKSYAIDLVAKISMPLQDGLSIYGKAGGAFLDEATSSTVNQSSPASVVTTSTSSTKIVNKILPTFGLGAGYEVNKNVTTDVSWMHIQKVGNTSLSNTDLVALGLTYHFG